jgi:hypothetical protein
MSCARAGMSRARLYEAKFENRLLAPSGYRVKARYRGEVPSTV